MKKITLLIFFTFISAISFAQEKGGIWGNITDFEMANEPLVFAQVELEGTSKSVQTNFHGNFELNDVVAGNYTLVISYLGYEKLEVPVVVENGRITRLQKGMSAMKFRTENQGETVTSTGDFGSESSSGQE